MAGWLDGYAPGGAPVPPRPRPQRAGWTKGQKRVLVEVMCCEECGSRQVKIRTSKGDSVVFLVCRECLHEWKDVRGAHLA
jgi:hypothetical protein